MGANREHFAKVLAAVSIATCLVLIARTHLTPCNEDVSNRDIEHAIDLVRDPGMTRPAPSYSVPDFVGILEGTGQRGLAEKWVDFMLSTAFQEDIPLQMFVFPVNQNAQLDPAFTRHLVVPEMPAFVSPEDIALNRERWIQEWTETVLR